MNNFKLLMAVVAALIISGCESDATSNLEESIVDVTPAAVGATTPYAKFDPSNRVIPFPNNLLFAGTADLTLNIPVDDATNFADPAVAMNALDGFSTVAPMTAEFSTSIDSTSISGTSVKLYEVSLYSSVSQPIAGPVIGVTDTLTFGVDYIAALSSVDTSNSTLAIVPLKPLAPSTSYMVVITDDLKTTDGKAFGPSVTYRLIKSLSSPLVFCSDPTASSCTLPGALRSLDATTLASFEGMRQIINTSNSTVATADASISTSDIILSWSFTTQSIGTILTQERDDIVNGAIPASALAGAPTTDNSDDNGILDSANHLADIYVGTLDVPYYLTAASSVNDPTPLASVWKGTGGADITPLAPDAEPNSTQTIPLMASIPKGTMPGAGWPVVIYQHGITSNRATMLALADAMANEGLAVVAIDLPLHGLRGNETNGTAAFKTSIERTFDLDLVDNTTSAPGPDGNIDSSTTLFINLSNLLNTRDNMRQAVTDLFTLTYSLTSMDAGGNTFDTSKIYFLGHSLGAIVGATFAALEPNVRDVAFAFGGGAVPKILDGSAAFGPTIAAGLAAKGVSKGTADFETFLGAAQSVVDTADPVNYSTTLATKTQGILFFEIAGDNSAHPSDLVVPNRVPDANDSSGTVPAPLAGTEPMLTLMGLTHVNASESGSDLKRSIKLMYGNHSSLLDPSADAYTDATTNLAVTTEIQTLAASFLFDDGGTINVTNPNLLVAP